MQNWDFGGGAYEQVFRVKGSAGWSRIALIVGAVLAFGIAFIGFVLTVFTHASPAAAQTMTTLPALCGIACIYGARTSARTPEELGVGPHGLRVITRGETRFYGWHEIGWSTVVTGLYGSGRMLQIFDTKGKVLLRVGDAVDGFEVLAHVVEGYIQRRPDDTAARIRVQKARRQALVTGIGGLFFLALSITVARLNQQEMRAERLLQERAVPGQGQIVRRFIAPNGVTPRLVYRVTTPDGKSGERNAEVDRDYYDSLAGKSTVPVRYVPGEPEISRLAAHEVERPDSMHQPVTGYGLPAAVGVMALVFLASSLLTFCGWEVRWDSETRGPALRRLGGAK